MEFKVVINDTKTGKSYQQNIDSEKFIGKKIKEKVDGSILGLAGYELQITGGSDSAGFPMRSDIEGSGRKKALLSGGIGVKISRKGMKKRKTVRGNTISVNTAQVNLKVIKPGSKHLQDIFKKPEEGKE
ncbi:MAG: 30S ribosomal protein S6e [Candidatus Woesearchaeota archaeon]|nr:30S ribosomal protein S6e [Candidatus Woesearchaeota archaeon]